MRFGQRLRNIFSPDAAFQQPSALVSPKDQVKQSYSFIKLGEQGEQMSEDIASLSARFEDVITMRDDFAAIVRPLNDVVLSHSRAQTRLAEQEVLLAQHLNTTKLLRAEMTDLQTNAISRESELAAVRHQINICQQQSLLDAETVNRLALEAGEAAAQRSLLERQLASEIEKSASLNETNRIKDVELIEITREAASNRARAAELFDELATSTSEVERLQAVVEQMQPELARSKQRIDELETSIHAVELNLQSSEAKVIQEQRERELLQSRYSQHRSDLEATIAATALHVEGLNSRHATTLRHLDQARALSNEKIEAAQKWERTSRDAAAACLAAERRLQIVEEQSHIFSEHNKSLEQSLVENKSRSEMLAKAVAAKDVLITQLHSKVAGLENHYAVLAKDLERERLQNEAAKRKLAEELEGERGERELAQGALSIARASREKMAAQIETYKRIRSASDQNSNSGEIGDDGAKNAGDEKGTNVHLFRSTDA